MPNEVPSSSGWRVAGRRYALAASVMLALGAMIAVLWSFQQQQTLEDRVVAEAKRAAAATQKLEQAKSGFEEQLATAGREVASLQEKVESLADLPGALAEASRRVKELRQELASAPLQGVLENLSVSFLRGGPTRGEHRVPIPEGAPRVALVVEVIDPEPYSRYRLQILDKNRDDTLVWESDRLLRRGSVLSLGVPSSLLEPGLYDVLLYGIDDKGDAVRLKESYLMKVVRTAAG